MSEKFHCYVRENLFILRVLLIKLTLDLNAALGSIDREQDLFREYWDRSLVFQDSFRLLEGL